MIHSTERELFEAWAADYGFHPELVAVHQYALAAARDAWDARAAIAAAENAKLRAQLHDAHDYINELESR